jgi:predicted aldo/keto reductase-like oxidoreductase
MELIMLKFGIYSIRVDGWLEVVEEFQSEGKIRFFIGLSTDGPTDRFNYTGN